MQPDTETPAVERQYEDPAPKHQTIWNLGIYATVVLIAAVFVIVILLALYVF